MEPRCGNLAQIWNFHLHIHIMWTSIGADFINININERKFIPLHHSFVQRHKYISAYTYYTTRQALRGGLGKRETCPWREISTVSRILDAVSGSFKREFCLTMRIISIFLKEIPLQMDLLALPYQHPNHIFPLSWNICLNTYRGILFVIIHLSSFIEGPIVCDTVTNVMNNFIVIHVNITLNGLD